MFADYLWYLGAKQQYNMAKSQGLAGLIGLLSVVLFVWKWDEWFLPIVDKLGLVDFAERIGIVHGLGAITVMNVIFITYIFILFILALVFIGFLVGLLLLMVGHSKIGWTIIMILTTPLWLPSAIIYKRNIVARSLTSTYQKDKELQPLLQKYKDLPTVEKQFELYIEQIKRIDNTCTVQSSRDKKFAKKILFRAVSAVKEDTNWLIALDQKTQKLHLLFPNPLPQFGSRSFYSPQEKEIGLYGIISQCWDAKEDMAPVPYYHSDHYVPSMEIEVNWVNGELELHIVKSEIKPFNILFLGKFYHIQGMKIQSFYRETLKLNPVIIQALNKAHVAYYVLQIAYKDTMYNEDEALQLYLEESKHVANGEALFPLYAADVEEEIQEHAENGESWAIEWLKRVESNW
ncbi:hypothetical protein [Bacillus cihuensis]|uniref:hypothetical protein n=1 Tax=Bacillus cihuensis TaxID=1208599 RepID=UPI0004259BDC|nr:hypothetical protein [Bacillus cihuensis]